MVSSFRFHGSHRFFLCPAEIAEIAENYDSSHKSPSLTGEGWGEASHSSHKSPSLTGEGWGEALNL